VRRRAWRGGWPARCLLLGLAGFLALNAVAWRQAWVMTHYAPAGRPPPKIEALSLPEKARAVALGVTVPRPENRHTPRDLGLAYEVRRIGLPGGEALEAWVLPHPQPRGVALAFPGYASSKESLLAPAAALHDLAYTVVLVDFRGAGGSTGDDTTLGVREAADVAAAFADAQRAWPGRPSVLYGVSMGSAAILRAIATHGVRPSAVILESPFDRLLATTQNRFRAMGLPAFPAAQLLVLWGSVQQGSNGFAHNPVDYARAVDCPALLLHGEQDPRVTTAQATAIFERLGGEKQFARFPDAGHDLLIATAPQDWERHVAGFLDRLDDR